MTEKVESHWLNKRQAADYLGVTTACLDRWIAKGFLTYYKLGPNKKGVPVRFKKAELEKWVSANRIQSVL